MTKATRARDTLEFEQEAVRLVEGGQSQSSVAKTLGLVEQTLFIWVKLSRQGQLKGADSKPVSAEQIVNRPGFLWRLPHLREWSHEEIYEVFTGVAGASDSAGV